MAEAAAQIETIEVDIPGGVKVTLPKDQAAKVIAERDRRAAEHRTLAEKVGAIEAAKAAAEATAAAETSRAKEIELAKKGEVDELRRLMTGDKDKAIGELSSQLVRLHVANLVATNSRLVPEARDDAISLLMSSAGFKLEGGKLQVTSADGRPLIDQAGQAIGTDAFVASWLEKRPHYLLDKTRAGSGAAGAGKPAGEAATITLAEYDAAQKDPGRAQSLAKEIASGKTRIVTG